MGSRRPIRGSRSSERRPSERRRREHARDRAVAAVPELRVGSWQQLLDALYGESWQPELQRHRSNFAFRGMNSARWDLRTSLMRLGGPLEELERHLLRNFRKYALGSTETRDDAVWSWMALGQHHGLPTRMLDWTYSPFVALHFATEDAAGMAEDGVVWCVDYVQARAHLPPILQEILDDEGSNVFTLEMLARGAASPRALDRLARSPFPLFVEPPSIDARIVNQYALFSLMSSASARLDEWLAEHPPLGRKIVIPAKLKWEVRDKLDQANLTERVLLPGLDGLSRWLRRYFAQRGEPQAAQRDEPPAD